MRILGIGRESKAQIVDDLAREHIAGHSVATDSPGAIAVELLKR